MGRKVNYISIAGLKGCNWYLPLPCYSPVYILLILNSHLGMSQRLTYWCHPKFHFSVVWTLDSHTLFRPRLATHIHSQSTVGKALPGDVQVDDLDLYIPPWLNCVKMFVTTSPGWCLITPVWMVTIFFLLPDPCTPGALSTGGSLSWPWFPSCVAIIF